MTRVRKPLLQISGLPGHSLWGKNPRNRESIWSGLKLNCNAHNIFNYSKLPQIQYIVDQFGCRQQMVYTMLHCMGISMSMEVSLVSPALKPKNAQLILARTTTLQSYNQACTVDTVAQLPRWPTSALYILASYDSWLLLTDGSSVIVHVHIYYY